jgi:glycosyltransferase involved in cell wall biosynthesis
MDDLADKVDVGRVQDADVGIFVGGYPPQIGDWLKQHRVKIALLITESETIPPDWADTVNADVDIVLAPSKWVAKVYRTSGVTKPIFVVQHGLHEVYKKPPFLFRSAGKRLCFGHVAGAASYLHRKGTPQLVKAFNEVFAPDEAQLIIRTPETPMAYALLHDAYALLHDSKASITLQWADANRQLSPLDMRSWYKNLHYLIQPSRAEAFGICPVEARACGVPVILTDCTGHKDHVHARDLVVPHGIHTSCVVNGIPDGHAPAVAAYDIANALRRAKREVANRCADAHALSHQRYAASWSWPAVTWALAKTLKSLSKKETKSLDDKLGL